jgi:ABC-type transport system involved in cytochrome c biogenesis ATPase subunit
MPLLSGHSPDQPLLSLQGLRFAFPGASSPVFDGFSAALPAGVGLVCGDEGKGKTTLLRLLAGQLAPAAGSMQLAGRPLQPSQVACIDPRHAERQDQVVQDVLDELVPPALRPQLAELLPGLDLLSHLPKPLYQLSTGSRRKVFLAAALVQPAPLTLLDQPFTALDRPSVDFLCDRFRAWTHQPDRLLLIADYLPPQDVPLAFTLDLDLNP